MLYSAGMSLRYVRSPEAPKMTTLHGCGIGRLERPSRSGLVVGAVVWFKAEAVYKAAGGGEK